MTTDNKDGELAAIEQLLSALELDLRSPNRMSYRGPATDLRECLREVLDHLAPDDAVTSGSGFVLEKDRTSPTMKQKVRFILRSRGLGKTALESPEASVKRRGQRRDPCALNLQSRFRCRTCFGGARGGHAAQGVR